MHDEMDTYHKHGVYRKVEVDECYSTIGKRPIEMRWVIINKGDRDVLEYRARLVAKEIKMEQRLETKLTLTYDISCTVANPTMRPCHSNLTKFVKRQTRKVSR